MSDARTVRDLHPALATLPNAAFIESLYLQYKDDPQSLPEHWRMFFEGFDLGMCPRTCVAGDQARKQSQVGSLIFAYRSRGHLIAKLDPLGDNLSEHPDLSLGMFDLADDDLDRVFDTGHLGGPARAPLKEILGILQDTYCRSLGVEYLHIQDVRKRRWLQAEMEPVRNRPAFAKERKLEILENLIDSELFETFLHKRYLGQKRFSLEGAESLIPAIHSIVELAPEVGVKELVMGMAHRGRLNVLANILDKSYAMIFGEFEDIGAPNVTGGDGDVKYHRGYSSDHVNRHGNSLHISLTSNPSHLEAVNPVVEGRTRAKQRQWADTERTKVLPLLIHGDAAFAGQGLVAETLNLSQLDGYRTGGTVHLIVNNQIGFTTLPRDARSTRYCTDVAKMIDAPVFHVNGDDPEAVVFASELALRYRQTFHADVVVDIWCYRRHGHNEGDEPAFTQPVLYKKIKNHPGVRKLYTRRLIEEGVLTPVEESHRTEDFENRLQQAFEDVAQKIQAKEPDAFAGLWQSLDGGEYSLNPVATSVSGPLLDTVTQALTAVPDGFALNPKVERQLSAFRQNVAERKAVDWGQAELLAYGTLLAEGTPVRLSGQDSERGTFSHRHGVWRDMNTQEAYVPLNHVQDGQARFCVYNSLLSEAAVLGFDYGYSLAEPRMLVLWEAQFGDFANGAQVIIDQFVVSSLSKWNRASGLVMLLPHGYEGQGPEHSNAYLERYLAACAENNMQVCNFTTPAQVFHAFRRQMKRSFRRPLVVMSPKSLLRHKLAVSPVRELTDGRFHEVLDDLTPPTKAKRIVLCSGKVAYDLFLSREADRVEDVALVRIEQLYPWPKDELLRVLAPYLATATELVWAQEEPANRGAWTFVRPRLQRLLPDLPLLYAGRPASASPATGSLKQHQREQRSLVNRALGLEPLSSTGDEERSGEATR